MLMVLVGLAGPLVMPPVTAVLLNNVPGHRAGKASGVFNTSRQVGGALAVAVFGAMLANRAAAPPRYAASCPNSSTWYATARSTCGAN